MMTVANCAFVFATRLIKLLEMPHVLYANPFKGNKVDIKMEDVSYLGLALR